MFNKVVTKKANDMQYFVTLFGKELYMFRTDLLSIIRSLNTVFTATGINSVGTWGFFTMSKMASA
jgi:hypothetical protein